MSLKETCQHLRTTKNGFRYTLKGPIQRYSCRDCGYKFVLVKQREKMTKEMVEFIHRPEYQTTSIRSMANILNLEFNVLISYTTIWNWKHGKR